MRGAFFLALPFGWLTFSAWFFYWGFEPLLNQLEYAAVGDTHLDASDELVVGDSIKVGFEVGIVDAVPALVQLLGDGIQCLMGTAFGSKSVGCIEEIGFKYRLQYQSGGGLYDAVSYRGVAALRWPWLS